MKGMSSFSKDVLMVGIMSCVIVFALSMAINFNNMMEHERHVSDRVERGAAISRILDLHRSTWVDPTDAWVIEVQYTDFDIVFKDVDILN